MMERKKETILELTNAAWSVLVEYNDFYKNGELNLVEAQKKAAENISKMRYGKEQKDYFWISSTAPKMIMHPYRTDLNGKDLTNYTDKQENRLFMDATQLVAKQQQGFIQYYWQWKDNAAKIVPKLSYVKEFAEWKWIIGTGIYLEDVDREIKQLKRKLFLTSGAISIFIALILFYVIRQSKIIEEKRKTAEHQLKLSIARYKSLIDASTEGTLMIVKQKVVFVNNRFYDLLENTNKEILGLYYSDLFDGNWDSLCKEVKNTQRTYSFESVLKYAKPQMQDVVVSVTQVQYANQKGHILAVKKVSEKKRMRINAQQLSEGVQLSLQLMNQPIKNLVVPNTSCQLNTSIASAIQTMSNKHSDIICILNATEIIGVVTDKDLRNRILNKNKPLESTVASIMSSPIVTINEDALLYEALLLFKQKQVSHLLVLNNYGRISGHISYLHCLEAQQNSLSFFINEIKQCTLLNDIKRIYERVPILIQAVFTSTDNINNISRIITSIADAINIRIIELALEEVGEPPCDFAFIAMGSEGRGEQTLKTDQDNALIFSENSKGNKDYFLKLSEIINENLHTIGYARCKGDLMAGNPEWCNSLQEWQALFSHWIDHPEKENVLDSSIFFDLRHIYGQQQLVEQLQQHIVTELHNETAFFQELAKTIIRHKPSLGKKHIDVKQFSIPLIGYVRFLALKNNIPETNTILRLQKLRALDLVSEMQAEEIEKIYNFLMHIRIKWQLELILDNDWPNNNLLVKNLASIELATFKNIMQQISLLQSELY